jgi:hypothetical protein
MAEMIIPGTHIDVRAEGLISAAGVATGIVGRELVTPKGGSKDFLDTLSARVHYAST